MKKTLISLAMIANLNALDTEKLNEFLKEGQNFFSTDEAAMMNYEFKNAECSNDSNCKISDFNMYLDIKDILASPMRLELAKVKNITISLSNEPKESENLYDFIQKANNYNIKVNFNDIRQNEAFSGILKSISFPKKDEFSEFAKSYIDYTLNNYNSDSRFNVTFKDNFVTFSIFSSTQESASKINLKTSLGKNISELKELQYEGLASLVDIIPYLNYESFSFEIHIDPKYFQNSKYVEKKIRELPVLLNEFLANSQMETFSDDAINAMGDELMSFIKSGNVKVEFNSYTNDLNVIQALENPVPLIYMIKINDVAFENSNN